MLLIILLKWENSKQKLSVFLWFLYTSFLGKWLDARSMWNSHWKLRLLSWTAWDNRARNIKIKQVMSGWYVIDSVIWLAGTICVFLKSRAIYAYFWNFCIDTNYFELELINQNCWSKLYPTCTSENGINHRKWTFKTFDSVRRIFFPWYHVYSCLDALDVLTFFRLSINWENWCLWSVCFWDGIRSWRASFSERYWILKTLFL